MQVYLVKTAMQVYFTSPTLGQIYGTATNNGNEVYHFAGNSTLINIELTKLCSGRWVCLKDAWLLDSQIAEIGCQIDQLNSWLSAK